MKIRRSDDFKTANNIICILLGLLFFPSLLWAENPLPNALLYYDNPGASVLLIDKSECTLSVYQYQQEWKKIDQFNCTSGKKKGDKLIEGDEKTPEGIYWFSHAWTGKELLDQYGDSANIYGIGAFELNYPNYVDLMFDKKSGYGIWLHGTDKLQPTETRGCVSTSNSDLLKISQYIKVGKTPIIIKNQVQWINEEQHKKEREQILQFVKEWEAAWESEDLLPYLSKYSKRFKTPKFRYQGWAWFKKEVNKNNQNRKVTLKDISIFKSKGIYHVQFVQKYSSTGTNDIGKKQLYLVKENEDFRILSEKWETLQPAPPTPSLQLAYKKGEMKGSL